MTPERDGRVITRGQAARAGVPIATLYQYFADREAVLHELAPRMVDKVDDELPARLAALEATTLDDAVDRLLVLHHAMYRGHSEIVVSYYANRDTAPYPDSYRHRARMAGMVHTFLIEPGLPRPDTEQLVTEVAVELADRILELAYHLAPEGDPRVVSETRRAMSSYLKTYGA